MARGYSRTARERAEFEGAGTGYIPRESEREGDRSGRSGARSYFAANKAKNTDVIGVLKENGVEKNALGLTDSDFATLSADQKNAMSMAIKTAITKLKREMAGPDGKGLEGKELIDVITSEGDDKESFKDLRDGIRDIIEQQYTKAMEKNMDKATLAAWQASNSSFVEELSPAETNQSKMQAFMAPVSKSYAREEFNTRLDKAESEENTKLVNQLKSLSSEQRVMLGSLIARGRAAAIVNSSQAEDSLPINEIDDEIFDACFKAVKNS